MFSCQKASSQSSFLSTEPQAKTQTAKNIKDDSNNISTVLKRPSMTSDLNAVEHQELKLSIWRKPSETVGNVCSPAYLLTEAERLHSAFV